VAQRSRHPIAPEREGGAGGRKRGRSWDGNGDGTETGTQLGDGNGDAASIDGGCGSLSCRTSSVPVSVPGGSQGPEV
jgi:hypothetical protein